MESSPELDNFLKLNLTYNCFTLLLRLIWRILASNYSPNSKCFLITSIKSLGKPNNNVVRLMQLKRFTKLGVSWFKYFINAQSNFDELDFRIVVLIVWEFLKC